jgi:uncharacterized GH25 family protein
MIFKTFGLSLLLLCFSVGAMAHDFWAGLEKADPGQPAVVFLGYGHAFPAPDAITPEVYAERFDPIKLKGSSGDIKLTQGANVYTFATANPLSKGAYYVVADSKAGFSGRTPTGYVRKSKAEDPEVQSCTYGASFGKNLLVVDKGGSDRFITKALGQKLEIVPQANPDNLKVGEKFPVKVLFDKKPLAGANVGAFFAGFSDHNIALAFSAPTNKDGLVDIIPLSSGQWLAKVTSSNPYSDPAVCDKENYTATLAFKIN